MSAFLTIDEEQIAHERAVVVVDNKRMVEQFGEVAIRTSDEAQGAAAMLGQAKRRLKDLEARRVDTKAPALEAGRRIDALFAELKEPVEQVAKLLESGILTFRKAEAARIEAANRRLEDELRAEEERQRAVQRAAEEEARREREAAERAAAEAARAASEGDHAQEAVMIEAQRAAEAARLQELVAKEHRPVVTTAPAPVAQAAAIKTDGATVSAQRHWEFRVIDPSKVPSAFKVVDEKAIRQAVREGVRDIPGVEIVETERLVTRA